MAQQIDMVQRSQAAPPVPKIEPIRAADNPADSPNHPNHVAISELGASLKVISGAVADMPDEAQRQAAEQALASVQQAGNGASIRIDVKALAEKISANKEKGIDELIQFAQRLKNNGEDVRDHIEQVKEKGQRSIFEDFQKMPAKTKRIGDEEIGKKTDMEKRLEMMGGQLMPKGVEAQVAKMKEFLQRIAKEHAE